MLLTLLLIQGAIAWYVGKRASWAFSLSRRGQRLLAATFVFGMVAVVLSRTLGPAEAYVARPLGVIGSAIVLGIVISSVLLVPIELGRFLSWLLRQLRRLGRRAAASQAGGTAAPEAADVELAATSVKPDPAAASNTEASPEPARRAFLVQAAVGGALSLGMGSALYGTFYGRREYTLETVPIRLAKLPRALDGLTIVQLSDLHVGTFIGERELGAALDLVRSAKADVVVLTGDLLDHDPHYAPVLARFARALHERARYGVYAVPGNHDHYAGVHTVLRLLREAGTEVLLNRHVRIGQGRASFVLAGLDDVQGPRFDGPGPQLEEALAGAPDELARVLLSHNPSFFRRSYGEADLTLSGHTHGGQITMFINTAELVLRHGLVRGHYDFDGSQLYVNRGFGTAGPPARIGSPPEVTRLVLTT